MNDTGTAAAVQRIIERFTDPDDRALLLAKLDRVLKRQKAVARFPTPAYLSQAWRPEFVQTPMLDAIDDALIQAESGLQRRWIINTPPQRGKTSRMQDGMAWMLLRNPRLNIGFASYEQGIASQSSLAIRQLIEMHGSGYRGQKPDPYRDDFLGLLLDPDRAMQTRWSLADTVDGEGGKPGGVLAVGVGGALTGRPLDVLVVDDPIKDAKQADSPIYRAAVRNWFQSVALTRLSKRGIVIVVQTRWHEDDLTGWLVKHDDRGEWRHLNIPAQAEENDALGRRPGEYLIDARGFTPEDWERVKREVGQRTWHALYQGNPAPPEGGVFQRAWFDQARVPEAPPMRVVVTFVDPADNTSGGDEAGICTGGIDSDGSIYILEDSSDHYTVSGWFRAALYAMLRHQAARLCYEKSLSGLKRAMRAEWRTMRIQARELKAAATRELEVDPWQSTDQDALQRAFQAGDAIAAVTDQLCDVEDSPEHRREVERQLMELWPYVPKVLALPDSGPPIRPITATGTKTYRATMASPLWENGTVHHVGQLPQLEHQMSTWFEGQDSPDRMDAVVHLVTYLNTLGVGAGEVKGAQGKSIPTRRAGGNLPVRSVPGRR